jgi:Flp pilus assembly protein TadD
MRSFATFLAISLAALTGGCATPAGREPAAPDAVDLALPERARNVNACGEEKVPQEVIMHLQLIEDMNRQGKYHAALAHLEALGVRGRELPRALFLRAEASRQVGETERARELFTRLSGSCLAGLGHHGLARIAADEGNLAEAFDQFDLAERERPTDPRIRNDHGYTLLLAGLYPEARRQFRTGWELGGGDQLAANLLLTQLVAGDEAGARRMAAEFGLGTDIVETLRPRAAELRAALSAARPRLKESGQ